MGPGEAHAGSRSAAAMRERTVIVPDLPGFGENPPLAAGLSLESYLDHLEDLIAEATDRWGARPIVVGHSFGSILVSHLAARSPEAIGELVLINPITSPALEGSARVLTALTRLYYAIAGNTYDNAHYTSTPSGISQ